MPFDYLWTLYVIDSPQILCAILKKAPYVEGSRIWLYFQKCKTSWQFRLSRCTQQSNLQVIFTTRAKCPICHYGILFTSIDHKKGEKCRINIHLQLEKSWTFRDKKYTWFWAPPHTPNWAAEFVLPQKHRHRQAYIDEFDILLYTICAKLFKGRGSWH